VVTAAGEEEAVEPLLVDADVDVARRSAAVVLAVVVDVDAATRAVVARGAVIATLCDNAGS